MTRRRILFIGNSFTNRNDLPATIAHLAAAADPSWKIETQREIANGMSLMTHWRRGVALKTIRSRDWDYVVLQEQSTLPLKNRPRMHESIKLFDTAIKDRGAKTVLYLTWARKAAWDRQDELTDAYASIGREIGALVVPVGVAWQELFREKKSIELHDRDGSHPNVAGSYLAACVFVSTLMHQSPVGLPGVDPLDSDVTLALQGAAWRAAQALSAARE